MAEGIRPPNAFCHASKFVLEELRKEVAFLKFTLKNNTGKAITAPIPCNQTVTVGAGQETSVFYPQDMRSIFRTAERLGLDLKEMKSWAAESDDGPTVAIGFCPERECPSNAAYDVRGHTFYRVTLQKGRYCAHCGEVLVSRCPECDAPLNEGACCTSCGSAYVN